MKREGTPSYRKDERHALASTVQSRLRLVAKQELLESGLRLLAHGNAAPSAIDAIALGIQEQFDGAQVSIYFVLDTAPPSRVLLATQAPEHQLFQDLENSGFDSPILQLSANRPLLSSSAFESEYAPYWDAAKQLGVASLVAKWIPLTSHPETHGVVCLYFSDSIEHRAPLLEEFITGLDSLCALALEKILPSLPHHGASYDSSTNRSLKELQRLAKIGLWTWDPITNLHWWSDMTYELLGMPAYSMHPSIDTLLACTLPEDREILSDAIRKVLTGTLASHCDFRVQTSAEQSKWMNLRAKATVDETGITILVEGTLQDISDRKRAEQKISDSRAYARAIIDSIPECVKIVDRQGTILEINAAGSAMVHCKYPQSIVGKQAAEFVVPEHRQRYRDFQKESNQNPNAYVEYDLICADESRISVESRAVPIHFAGQNYQLCITHDVTTRKRAAQALQESEERLRIALQAASAIAFEWEIPTDRVTRYYSVEPTLPSNPDHPEAIDDVQSVVLPEDQDVFRSNVLKSLKSGTEYRNLYRVRRPDKSIAWLEEWGIVQRDTNGSPLKLCGISIDVTQRIEAMADFQKTSNLLRAIVDGTTDIIFMKNLDGQYILLNAATAKLMGITQSELLGKTDFDFFSHDFANELQSKDRQVVETGLTFSFEEDMTIHGKTRTFLTTKGPYRDESGKIVGVFGVSRDISDRKRSESILAIQHEVFQNLARAGSIEEIASTMLTSIGTLEQWDHGAWFIANAAEKDFELVSRWTSTEGLMSLDSLAEGLDLQSAVVPFVASDRHTTWLESIELLKGKDRKNRQSTSTLGSFLGIPFLASNQVIGIACFYGKKSREYDQEWLKVFDNLGIQVGQFIEKQKSEGSIRLFRMLIDQTTDAIQVIDAATARLIDVNQRACEAYGYTREEFLRLSLTDIESPHSNSSWTEFVSALRRKSQTTIEGRHTRKDGTTFPVESNVHFISSDREYVVAIVRDISDRKQMEEHLRQVQKMEAVGRLAGGVAHDFNNLMTVINCHAELLLAKSANQPEQMESVLAIQHAGQRATELTAQLLAFSRRTLIEPRIISLNKVLESTRKLLCRLIREDIEQTFITTSDPLPILADTTQIEQVIMNLAVNGADAMPNGGTLTFRTYQETFSASHLPESIEIPWGTYACLDVTDSGLGMTEEIKSRIFEPFFTTKDVGKGTGLGLAVVHGVLTQCGGFVNVKSKIGMGTTFRLYFPLHHTVAHIRHTETQQVELHGKETILLVEDEELVRRIAADVLKKHGFEVIVSESSLGALDILQAESHRIDLIVTDVVMPGIGGIELAQVARRLRPGLRHLFMSGYTEEILPYSDVAQNRDSFLQKPFTAVQLVAKIREMLDEIL